MVNNNDLKKVREEHTEFTYPNTVLMRGKIPPTIANTVNVVKNALWKLNLLQDIKSI